MSHLLSSDRLEHHGFAAAAAAESSRSDLCSWDTETRRECKCWGSHL